MLIKLVLIFALLVPRTFPQEKETPEKPEKPKESLYPSIERCLRGPVEGFVSLEKFQAQGKLVDNEAKTVDIIKSIGTEIIDRMGTKFIDGLDKVGTKINDGLDKVGAKINDGLDKLGTHINEGIKSLLYMVIAFFIGINISILIVVASLWYWFKSTSSNNV